MWQLKAGLVYKYHQYYTERKIETKSKPKDNECKNME